MEEMKKTQTRGMGLVGILTIIFIVLKLTGTISWSWWWVLSPLWIEFLIILVIIGIVAFSSLIDWI